MLTNSLKISDITKREFLERIYFHIAQKIGRKDCHADLSSVLVSLTCLLPVSVLTRGFQAFM